MRFVLDSTVSMCWLSRTCSPDDRQYAEQVLASLIKNEAWVPSAWWIELTHYLATSEQTGLTTEAASQQFLRLLEPLPIVERVISGAKLLQKTLELSRRHGLGAHRAVYLALTLLEGLPLATLDKTLREAARKAGVQAYGATG